MTTASYLDRLSHEKEDKQFERQKISRLQEEASRIQKKTYTNWINVYLKPENMEVTDLYTDLSDGVRLLKLLEIISKTSIGKPNRAVLRVQKMENVGRAITFVKSKVTLENIGAEDIVDGNPTLILGLMWTIILRFQIEEITIKMIEETGQKKSAKEALLLWCQNKTKGYQNVDVKDFTRSWRDGLAFGALLNSHQPDSMDMSRLDPKKPMENLEIVFKVAENVFDVPQMLDPIDVNLTQPDERSIMTYVSTLYQNLNKQRNKNKNAHRVGKTIDQAISLSSYIHDYEVSITALLQWIRFKTNDFTRGSKDLPSQLSEVTKLISNFTNYRRVEKSNKYQERTKLEELLFKIHLLVKELRARPYSPTDSQLKLATIETAWTALAQSEHIYEMALREAYQRLENIEKMASRFNQRASLREEFLDETEKLTEALQMDPGTMAGAARKAESLRVEIESKEKRFGYLNDLAQQLIRANYYKLDAVRSRNGMIQTRWGQLSGVKMKSLLARLAFPQTRADIIIQLELIKNRIGELETQLTSQTKAERDFTEAKQQNRDIEAIPIEVVQAALDRHVLAEAEMKPLERTLLQIQNTIEKLWDNAPTEINIDGTRAGDMNLCAGALKQWVEASGRGKDRKSRLEAMTACYNVSASLTQETNWVRERLQLLSTSESQSKDPRTARDLQLAQRLCKKHQTLSQEIASHFPVWEDLKRDSYSFLNSRSSTHRHGEDDTADDSKGQIKRQIEMTTSMWMQLQADVDARKTALFDCLESAQFYADAEEAKRWIAEKIGLIVSAGILPKAMESNEELTQAFQLCGTDYSATQAQERRLNYLKAEMEAFNTNDMQRLKYHSTLLRKPMDNRTLKPELLNAPENESDDDEGSSSDIDEPVTRSAKGKSRVSVVGKDGRAQAIASYHAQDPAGRDIDLVKGEFVAVIECANKDWWHISRSNKQGHLTEGFVPANRLRLLEAPLTGTVAPKLEAFKAVKLEVSRGLSIRHNPSVRSDNQLHFDKDNIQKCEMEVITEYDKLQSYVQGRNNCLQDTLAWHEFSQKCNTFEDWTKKKFDLLSSNAQKTSWNSSPNEYQTETILKNMSTLAPLLSEIEELAKILTGEIVPNNRSIYKRKDGPLFYKAPTVKRLKELNDQWTQLNKLKKSIEAQLASSGSTSMFEKDADTLDLLIGDRIAQLENMSTGSSDSAVNATHLRQVKAIEMEISALKDKVARLTSLGESVLKSSPQDSVIVNGRLASIKNEMLHLQNLVKTKSEELILSGDYLKVMKKMKDLNNNLNYSAMQIDELNPSADNSNIRASNAVSLQSLLPPDLLRSAIRKADEIDEDLNVFDATAQDIQQDVNALPDNHREKDHLIAETNTYMIQNETLKRNLDMKRDALEDALKAKIFAGTLVTIGAHIKDNAIRIQVTEPMYSASDVDRERREVADIKLGLEKNRAAVDLVDGKIKAANLNESYTSPLFNTCESLRNSTKEVLAKVKARDDELLTALDNFSFHDFANDFGDWLEEKQAVVRMVKGNMERPGTLAYIRGQIKRLNEIDAELTANDKALAELKDKSASLSPSVGVSGLPDPGKRVIQLRDDYNNLRQQITDLQKQLKTLETAAEFKAEADQSLQDIGGGGEIVANRVESAFSACPPDDQPYIPQNLAEAQAALNNAQKTKRKFEEDLTKLNNVEAKAKNVGAYTPELAAQLDKERARLKNQLAGVDSEIVQNEELVAWYKLADEMVDLKNWADARSNDVETTFRDNEVVRTQQEQNMLKQKHERIRKEVKLKDPRVQQLLDPNYHPMPTCLSANRAGERERPALKESWKRLNAGLSARTDQLQTAIANIDILSEMSELIQLMNAKAADVDNLVNNFKSHQAVATNANKLKVLEESTNGFEPKVFDLSEKVQRQVNSETVAPALISSLNHTRETMKGAHKDLCDKIHSAKRSLILQNQIFELENQFNECQEDITDGLGFLGTIEIGEDPSQIEKIKVKWDDFLAKIPKLLDRVNGCLGEGQRLSNDLDDLQYSRDQAPRNAGIKNGTTDAKSLFGKFGIDEMSRQTPMEYPFCNDQSINRGKEQVQSNMQRLDRDKILLQQQLNGCQAKIDYSDEISRFNEQWSDTMEQLRSNNAHLTALCATVPKSRSVLVTQVAKHESMEAELVHIRQQVIDVAQKGNDMVAMLKKSSKSGNSKSNARTSNQVIDKLNQLSDRWQELDKKVVEHRKILNDCNEYLEFCEQMRNLIFWCQEAEHEIATTETAAKSAALSFSHVTLKLIDAGLSDPSKSPSSPGQGLQIGFDQDKGNCMDFSQAKLRQADLERLTVELNEKWKPSSMRLVSEAEKLIDGDHYAAVDLKNKVDQLVVAQRSAEDGLTAYDKWILQLLDLLQLKREQMQLISHILVQRARLLAIGQECSSKPNQPNAYCDKLNYSCDVTVMQKRANTIAMVLQSTQQRVDSSFSLGKMMIEQRHYSSTQVQRVMDDITNSMKVVKQMCTDQLDSLQRRYIQLVWTEDAQEVESWLQERETELMEIIKPQQSSSNNLESKSAHDIVVNQLNILKRQKNFQKSIMNHKSHIDELLERGNTLMKDEIDDKNMSNKIEYKCSVINKRWKFIMSSIKDIASTLDQSNDLLNYQNEADALERWLREKDILMAKGDLGSDFDHCMDLKENVNEPAAGKMVNDDTMKEFRDLATRLVTGLRKAISAISRSESVKISTVATSDSVDKINNRTADYIGKRTNDIESRWKRISERLQVYITQLQLAATIHTILNRVGGLVLDANERKYRVESRDDLLRCQTVDDLETILHRSTNIDRELSVMETQLKNMVEEVKSITETISKVKTSTPQDKQMSNLISQIQNKMATLEETIKQTKILQKKRQELIEAKLAGQKIIESCEHITEWAEDLSNELQPHIVGVALTGLQAKIAGMMSKSRTPLQSQKNHEHDEKQKILIVKLRARITASQSELPLRKQNLAKLQSQSKSTIERLKVDKEQKVMVMAFGELSTGLTKELIVAHDALKRAEEIVGRLAIQVEIEEKRQDFIATGKQEARWIDSVEHQVQQAARNMIHSNSDSDESSDDEEGSMVNGDGPIVIKKSSNAVFSAPPLEDGDSQMSTHDCLALIDVLDSSIEVRGQGTLESKLRELQNYRADPNIENDVYPENALQADTQVYEQSQVRSNEVGSMLANLRSQLTSKVEYDTWFTSITESLNWLRENEQLASHTYDWRVTLERFGQNIQPDVRGNSRKPINSGSKGSKTISKTMANHRQYLIDIDVGLDMVTQLKAKGEGLQKAIPKKSKKIGAIIEQLTLGSNQLQELCKERTKRLKEADILVKWGYLMDEATNQADRTESMFVLDDYGVGETGLNNLLTKHELTSKDLGEGQTVRADTLLKEANAAQQSNHFAGQLMVQQAEELQTKVKNTLPQLAITRQTLLQLLVTWRRMEKEIRIESAWLKEQLSNSCLANPTSLDNNTSENVARQLNDLTELTARVTLRTAAIDAIIVKVKQLSTHIPKEVVNSRIKSIQDALSIIQDAPRTANQLENQKNELIDKIATVGHVLIDQYKFTKCLYEIQKAEDWLKYHMQPASKLAPLTDSSGTKATVQLLTDLRNDAVGFQSNILDPLTTRVQQFKTSNVSSAISSTDDQVNSVISKDLRQLIQNKNAGKMPGNDNNQRLKEDLDNKMTLLTSRYQTFSRYLELIRLKLTLHLEVHKYNIQADNFNKYLEELNGIISSNDCGSNLQECESILSKFNESLEGSSHGGAAQLATMAQKSKELLDSAAYLCKTMNTEIQNEKHDHGSDTSWISVPKELRILHEDVQIDVRTLQERQLELNRKWADVRTAMKTRKEALQAAIYVHTFMSDTDDLLVWISTKSPQAKNQKMAIALLGKASQLVDDKQAKCSSSLDKALHEQEKLRREVTAMQKQIDQQDNEHTRLCKEYPDHAIEVRKQWTMLQTSWEDMKQEISNDRLRLMEAQQVTAWQNRCNLLISWAEQRRYAMQSMHDIPTNVDEATHLLNEHLLVKTQTVKRTPERDDVIRSGRDLSLSIPSSKIVIQKNIEKLEASWTQMQNVWSNRNSLYEKNLDLRKLLAEMTDLENWLEEQEQRLERLTSITMTSVNTHEVDRALANHASIQKAIEDAQVRFESIQRKTLLETLALGLLQFMVNRKESGTGMAKPMSETRIAQIQRRETSKIQRKRSKLSSASKRLGAEDSLQRKASDVNALFAPIVATNSVSNIQNSMPILGRSDSSSSDVSDVNLESLQLQYALPGKLPSINVNQKMTRVENPSKSLDIQNVTSPLEHITKPVSPSHETPGAKKTQPWTPNPSTSKAKKTSFNFLNLFRNKQKSVTDSSSVFEYSPESLSTNTIPKASPLSETSDVLHVAAKSSENLQSSPRSPILQSLFNTFTIKSSVTTLPSVIDTSNNYLPNVSIENKPMQSPYKSEIPNKIDDDYATTTPNYTFISTNLNKDSFHDTNSNLHAGEMRLAVSLDRALSSKPTDSESCKISNYEASQSVRSSEINTTTISTKIPLRNSQHLKTSEKRVSNVSIIKPPTGTTKKHEFNDERPGQVLHVSELTSSSSTKSISSSSSEGTMTFSNETLSKSENKSLKESNKTNSQIKDKMQHQTSLRKSNREDHVPSTFEVDYPTASSSFTLPSKNQLVDKMARKIISSPNVKTKLQKWIPSTSTGHYTVLLDHELSFYDKENSYTKGLPPDVVYNIKNANISRLPINNHKSHPYIVQITLEDTTVLLLATPSLNTLNQWYNQLHISTGLPAATSTTQATFESLVQSNQHSFRDKFRKGSLSRTSTRQSSDSIDDDASFGSSEKSQHRPMEKGFKRFNDKFRSLGRKK